MVHQEKVFPDTLMAWVWSQKSAWKERINSLNCHITTHKLYGIFVPSPRCMYAHAHTNTHINKYNKIFKRNGENPWTKTCGSHICVNSHTHVGNADIVKGQGKSHDITGRVMCLTDFSLYVTWKSPQRLHTFLGYFSSLESELFYSVCSVDGLLIDQCPQIPVLGPGGGGRVPGWVSCHVLGGRERHTARAG